MTSSYGAFRQVTVLDGVQFALEVRWNRREARWFMDIYDASGNLLIAGVPFIMDYPLTYKSVGRIPGLPAGQFFVADETQTGKTPTRDNLGGDIRLIYVEAAGV